jgi:hypothetical protein
MPDIPPTGLSDQMLRESTFQANLAQELIATTKDKIELCLLHHQQELQSQREWTTPFATLVTVLLTLLTADFKDGLGFKKEVWQAIFVVTAIISALWFLYAGAKAIRSWWNRKGSIDSIIAELKATQS